MGILDARASVAADKAYLKLTDIVDASSDFAPASALTRLQTIETNLGIVTRPATPSTTTAPTFWLRSDTLSGLNSGDPVQNWASQTGSGNAVPNTNAGGTAPTYLPNAIAGKPAVRFTKASISKMGFGTAASAQATNHTVLVVARLRTIANGSWLLHGINDGVSPNAGSTMGIRAGVSTTGAFLGAVFGGTNSTPSTTADAAITANQFYVFGVEYSAGSAPQVILNGVAAAEGVGATDTPGTMTKLALGGYNTGSSDFDYAEIIYFGTRLSTADRKTWEQYLASTYALTVTA